MKDQTIKRVILIYLFALIFFIVQLNTIVAAEEIEDETIEAALNNYDRASSYDALYDLFLTLDPVKNPDQYFSVLTTLIDIERFYWNVYDLTQHTVLLYEEADKADNSHYMIKALIGLSEINFYNYQNQDALENLSEALVLIERTGNETYLPEYYAALADLHSDDGDYELAIENYGKSLEVSSSQNSSGIRQFNYIWASLSLAYEHSYYDEYNLSIEVLEDALDTIDHNDFEGVLYLQMELIDYYITVEDLKMAAELYTKISYDYYNASEYFQGIYSETYLLRLAGDMAYYEGAYQSAAVYYKDAFIYNVDFEALGEEIDSVEIINDFNDNKVKEVLSLHEAYQKSQDKVIRAYQVGLGITVILIFIIVLVLYIMVNQRKKLHEIAIKDQLTGVYNRRFVLEKYEKMTNTNKCIALADLDHFKDVNDRLGHNVGDQVLVSVVEIMNANLDEGDYLGRYGGEEFLIVFGSDDPVIAQQKVAKICHDVEHHLWNEPGLSTTISIGLVSSETMSGPHLIHKADESLYFVKNNGRNGFKYQAV